MGDLNDVRVPSERHDSMFNKQGASMFNTFINTSSLIDMPFGGFSFTWADKNATKMSKLDRFLMLEGLLCQFHAMSGLILARHLSDHHRPIVLRECDIDYGPFPFKMFHLWFDLEGFEQLVKDSWHNDVVVDLNEMSYLKKKFQMRAAGSYVGVSYQGYSWALWQFGSGCYENWLGECIMKVKYLRLFALEENKEVSIRDKVHNEFVEEQDKWVWNLEGEGVFTVSSARRFIDEGLCEMDGMPTRWLKLIPIRVNVLAWRLALNKLPTRFNMSVRGLEIPSIVCPVCHIGVETTHHLFFSCSVASSTVAKVLGWWGLPDIGISSYQEWVNRFDGLRLRKEVKEYLEGKHACVDLTGVSPLGELSSRGFTVGQAALKAASCKVTKHEKACVENQHVFIPFAFDTFGFLAPEAVEFLISENLFITYPHIRATTLERYLSDHRPILLRESSNDYGPVPFRFFHHWIELEGFNNFVVDTWKTAPGDASNEVINDLQHMDKLNAMDMAQKTKIKWSVEGDENSQIFNGMLNKKRNQLNIRGVMVDGVWNEKPHDVKREFFQHFSKRFDKPMEHRIIVDMCYPRSLLIDHQEDLERVVTKEEMTIEHDVFEAVSHFFTHADIPKGCNPSFIALILKIPDANMVSDFRPISLIGSIYKIIAKILANRLVRVLGDIVNEVQSAFIAERQILDGPFILNEVLQWCKIKKKQSLIFKVDFEKAYDSVRWDFLDDVLKKFGFGNKWCDWIQTCLKSSRGSILINGSPTEEFQFCKGLKQGDPLSPFLFILIMESLHLSFQRVVDAGLFMGIKLSHSVNLSHMFYADDAVFVGQWSDRNINTLIHVLDCFYRASGLRMNMRKSKIMGVHVEGGKVKHAASKLGCLILNTPFSYLGSKVGGSMSRVQAWKEVIDKVKSRLSKWKMKALSLGGRLTLLKLVLGSIPIFHMSIFQVPSSVLHTLESIRSHFFNGHERFYNQKTSLWANVIKAIHGEDGSMEFMRLKLGNVDTASFWNDNWSGGGVLKDLYPRLYALENGKSVNVCTKLSDPSMDYSFRRKTRGGAEQVQLDALLELVSTVNFVPMGDRWVWTLESSGEFSVASLRKVIDEKRLPSVCSKTRWVKYVSIKVNVLAWKIKMDVLPTRLNISRRGIDIRSISCPICDCGVESSEHLFFRCKLTREIARKISLWWNVNYEDVNSYDE
ncbi:RNA-directed DNA polymerase, eukaryota [Tanacetum coccineum]